MKGHFFVTSLLFACIISQMQTDLRACIQFHQCEEENETTFEAPEFNMILTHENDTNLLELCKKYNVMIVIHAGKCSEDMISSAVKTKLFSKHVIVIEMPIKSGIPTLNNLLTFKAAQKQLRKYKNILLCHTKNAAALSMLACLWYYIYTQHKLSRIISSVYHFAPLETSQIRSLITPSPPNKSTRTENTLLLRRILDNNRHHQNRIQTPRRKSTLHCKACSILGSPKTPTYIAGICMNDKW